MEGSIKNRISGEGWAVLLWHETVVGGGGVGPRDLHLYGDGGAGGAGGRTLPGGFLGGPGDHLVKTVATARMRAGSEI